MGEKMPIEKKKCTTPEFRVSFPHVFEKHAYEKNEPKYELTMLFDKDEDLKELKRAVHFALIEEFGEDKKKWPKGLRMPFRDGDEKADLMGYEGKTFVRATSKQRPQVVGPKKIDGQFPRLEKDDDTFYAGCYARATLIAFYYSNSGNKGVSFALQNVQKLRDGERFSGRKDADDEFDDVADSSDDESSYETSDAQEESYGF